MMTTAALALVLLVGELAILRWSLTRDVPLSTLLLAHVLVVSPAGAWLLRPACRTDRHAVLLGLSAAAFGPLGPAGALMAMALERYHARRAVSIEAWHQTLFPTAEVDERAELWRRVGQRASDRAGDPQVTPFLDVLAYGSVQQRQAVIGIIVQHFRPAFAPALKAALRDEHNVVRVQAATAIARLEQEFLERTLDVEAAVRRSPEDAQAILALATHYDEQAFAGLFDSAREEECRVKAADGYERYLRQRPDDHAVELRLARSLLRRRLFDEAEPRLCRLVESGHDAASLWLMEALFARGRYVELRRLAGRHAAADTDLTPEAAATVDLWAGREAAT
jgi:hypothetical protein